MNKKIWIAVSSFVVLAIAYWLLSPLWRQVPLNEELPGTSMVAENNTAIKDNMEVMDEKTKMEFEKQAMEMSDKIMKKNEIMPNNQPQIISRVDLVPRAHDVEGSALIVKSGNTTFLRFEDLKTINGPDLRIYLSNDLSADDIVDLGSIRATEGNVNYEIPAGTDLAKYKNAMIWCRTFGVLFSYATF
jgi:hypothetical protein